MSKAELLKALKACADNDDPESAHSDADDALLEYINDAEVDEAYAAISKWYA